MQKVYYRSEKYARGRENEIKWEYEKEAEVLSLEKAEEARAYTAFALTDSFVKDIGYIAYNRSDI